MNNLPSLVRTKIFSYLDRPSKSEARLVCHLWNQEILGWAGLSVLIDELDSENAEFLQKLGLVHQGTLKSLRFDQGTRHILDLLQTAIFKEKMGPNALKEVFKGKRLRSLHLKERFIYQGFSPVYFLRSSSLVSATLRELRLTLPFLGRPRVKYNGKLSRDISLVLNNIHCPNLHLLEIQETVTVAMSKCNRAILSFQRLAIDEDKCWDKDALRNFLFKHEKSLRKVCLSPVRSFSFNSGFANFPRRIQQIHLDLIVMDLDFSYKECGYWTELFRLQEDLRSVRLGITWLNSQSILREDGLTWPQVLLSSIAEKSEARLEHVSLQCSGCKRKDRAFLDLSVLGGCIRLQNLFLRKTFVEGESYRTIGFPTIIGVEKLPLNLKKLRLINLYLSTEQFLSLTRLTQIQHIYWTLLPRSKFVFVHPRDLVTFFNLRSLESLNFPIDMEAYDLLVSHRVLCNVYHTAEIGAENQGIATQDLEI